MTHLLDPISWNTYLASIGIAGIAWYAYISWRYYRKEIQSLFYRLTGKSPDNGQLPSVLQYREDPALEFRVEPATVQEDANREPHAFSGAGKDLSQKLLTAIAAAQKEPYNPAALIQQLKQILNDYPDIASTTERDAINNLIARECEDTGTALLSESEVDTWWSA